MTDDKEDRWDETQLPSIEACTGEVKTKPFMAPVKLTDEMLKDACLNEPGEDDE